MGERNLLAAWMRNRAYAHWAPSPPSVLKKRCPLEFGMMMEWSTPTLSDMVVTSRLWLWRQLSVASATEKLDF